MIFDLPQQVAPLAPLVPSTAAELLRVVIAGEPNAREVLSSIAGSFDDVLVLDEVAFDERLFAIVPTLTPDVLVCDVAPDSAPLAPIARLATPSLFLVGTAAQRAEAVRSGARGVIERSPSPRRLHAALRAVSEGLHVVDDAFQSGRSAGPIAGGEEEFESLTARELDVIELLAAGRTNKEIAQRLGITEHTVKFHVNAILGKLSAETRTEAVVNAAKRGIVTL